MECKEIDWLFKHKKKVRCSQASISINSCTELSKTQFSQWVTLKLILPVVQKVKKTFDSFCISTSFSKRISASMIFSLNVLSLTKKLRPCHLTFSLAVSLKFGPVIMPAEYFKVSTENHSFICYLPYFLNFTFDEDTVFFFNWFYPRKCNFRISPVIKLWFFF